MNFTVSELGSIWLGRASRQLEGGDLELAEEPFNALKSLLEVDQSPDAVHDQFFKFGMRRGRECLRIQNYVGVLQCDGHQIEVLPKLSRVDEDISASRAMLVKMLSFLRDAPFKESQQANLDAHEMPLFELVYRDFVEKTANTVRRGLARTYVSNEGNLYFLRGKLKIQENIRQNVGLANRVYCEFDEYDLNRPANRLLAAAIEVVIRHSRNPETQNKARELRFYFEGVPSSLDFKQDFQAIVRDRNIAYYSLALSSARLILFKLNPLTQTGRNAASAMLFPMERVFEDYVSAQLARQFPAWKVTTQAQTMYLVEEHAGKRMFALRPDIIMAMHDRKLVADTKWKLLDGTAVRNKYDISQADMYQLYAYGRKYLSDHDEPFTVLIYPKSDRFSSPLPEFKFESGGASLFVTAFDCATDEWLLPARLVVYLEKGNVVKAGVMMEV